VRAEAAPPAKWGSVELLGIRKEDRIAVSCSPRWGAARGVLSMMESYQQCGNKPTALSLPPGGGSVVRLPLSVQTSVCGKYMPPLGLRHD
jgi:hypothetical protein